MGRGWEKQDAIRRAVNWHGNIAKRLLDQGQRLRGLAVEPSGDGYVVLVLDEDALQQYRSELQRFTSEQQAERFARERLGIRDTGEEL